MFVSKTEQNKNIWEKSLSNECRQLSQGNIHGLRHTYIIEFLYKSEVTKDKDVTYAKFVCNFRALKDDPYRIRITVG